MSATSVSGDVTVTINTTEVTLKTADINQTPKVFSLPKGQTAKVNLGDLNTYLSTSFPGFPAVNFPGITETSLVIDKFYISTEGVFDVGADFIFGAGQGWTVFPGFKLDRVGFEVNYSTVPNITNILPASASVGAIVTINGYDLDKATKVDFGGVTATIVANSNTATSVKVKVPQLPAGTVQVKLTNTDGTSAAETFTVAV